MNNYIVYRKTVTIPTTHLIYRRLLVESLAVRVIATAPPRPLVGRPRKRRHPDNPDPERLNSQLHLIARWDRQRDCIVCSRQSTGERRRTYYYCKTCKDNSTLHPDTCFERGLPHDAQQLQAMNYSHLSLPTYTDIYTITLSLKVFITHNKITIIRYSKTHEGNHRTDR